MQLLKYFLIVSVCTISYAQTVYELVPGSKNNLFELSFSNSLAGVVQSLNISVQEAPEWIEFNNNEINIDDPNIKQKPTAQFYFNNSDKAPVGEEGIVNFRITDQSGRKWFKSYKVKVSPPKIFELYQNYPNPFNPTTTIKYSIPQDAFVTIKVFNVLGEKVSELVNEEIKTGIHEIQFNAENLSSGIYFYTVEAKGLDGTNYFDSKKMTFLK